MATALLLFFRANEVSERADFLRTSFIRAIGVGVLVEAYVNLYVFPLPVELILLPVLAVLAATAAVAEGQDEYVAAAKLINVLVGLIGVGFLVYVTAHLAADSGPQFAADLRRLALPAWLTVCLLPFIYLLGLLIAYETAFLQIYFAERDDRKTRRRAKLALLVEVNVRASVLGRFRAPWPYRLVHASNLRNARAVARELRRSQS